MPVITNTCGNCGRTWISDRRLRPNSLSLCPECNTKEIRDRLTVERDRQYCHALRDQYGSRWHGECSRCRFELSCSNQVRADQRKITLQQFPIQIVDLPCQPSSPHYRDWLAQGQPAEAAYV